MNSRCQTVFDIKSRSNDQNPFILKMHANSTSQQQVNLSVSGHMLKKLSLIEISESRQLVQLYKQCLLDVIENPLLNVESQQVIQEVLYFIQYWQTTLGRLASWPHTRTCFYYLQDKLKKNKLPQNLDLVRLKRAQLEPNKKQFLSQIMAEDIQNQQLKSYIAQLKQQSQIVRAQAAHLKQKTQLPRKENNPDLQDQQSIQLFYSKNILYSDSKQDWKLIQDNIQLIAEKGLSNQIGEIELKILDQQLHELFETYLLEKLPVLINQMKSKRLRKQQILEQLNYRKSVVDKVGVSQFSESINLAISKFFYNHVI